jgi:hypothetical protein
MTNLFTAEIAAGRRRELLIDAEAHREVKVAAARARRLSPGGTASVSVVRRSFARWRSRRVRGSRPVVDAR